MKGKRRNAPREVMELLKYLETASNRGVGQIQLNKLNEAANLRDRIQEDLRDWTRVTAEALFADWVLLRREEELHSAVPAAVEAEVA